jgi:hypothetical protein
MDSTVNDSFSPSASVHKLVFGNDACRGEISLLTSAPRIDRPHIVEAFHENKSASFSTSSTTSVFDSSA